MPLDMKMLKEEFAAETISIREYAAASLEERLQDTSLSALLDEDEIVYSVGDIGMLDLARIFDVPAMQSLITVFSRLTGVPVAILDTKGTLYASAGWQDICTMFHRVHPLASKRCQESDTQLNRLLKKSECAAYKCGNALWDMVTPVYIGDRHVANIFTGQFFYDDEAVDVATFAAQAAEYGFDRDAYLEALGRVPRFSRQRMAAVMDFLTQLAGMLSSLGYGNFELTRGVVAQKRAKEELKRSQDRLMEMLHWKNTILNTTGVGILVVQDDRIVTEVNAGITAITGYEADELVGRSVAMLHVDEASSREFGKRFWAATAQGGAVVTEWRMRRKNGEIFWCELTGRAVNAQDIRHGVVWMAADITARKEAETAQRNEAELLRVLFLASPDALMILDRRMRVVEANTQFAKLVDRPLETIPGLSLWNFEAKYSRQELERVGRSIGFGYKKIFESVFRRPDGSLIPVELAGRVMHWRDRQLAVYAVRDLTRHKATQEALREREELNAAMVRQASVGVVLIDTLSLDFVEFNDVACTMLGYAREEFSRVTMQDIDSKQESGAFEQRLAALQEADSGVYEVQYVRKDGSLVDILVSSRIITTKDRPHALSFWTDITARKKAEDALRSREQEARTLLDHSPDRIIRYDRQLRRVYVNFAAAETIGVSPGEGFGSLLGESPLLDKASYRALLEKVMETGQEAEKEVEYRVRKGGSGWGLTRFVPEFDRDNSVVSVLSITRDITELVRQREQLHQMAFYDALTGLPNRALFHERIRQAVGDCCRNGRKFVLLTLDVDNFKDINDTLGHAAGDRMLSEIARRLSARLRTSDTLSRLGGDEFALLLPGVRTSRDMGAVARSLLDAIAQPLRIDGRDVFVTASIGIAVYPDDTQSLDELFAFGDTAMYHAKATGRNNYQFYDAMLTKAAKTRLSLGGQLRHALARDQFELYYQPKVSMPEGRVLGAEALLRWNHPDMGLLAPPAFIGIAEDSGQIVEIGRWALDQACAAVVRWNRARDVPLRVAVNLSSRQFVRNDLVATVEQALVAHDCPGRWLELEITESLVLADNPDIQKMLESFSRLGASIAIDDFGTGHSALCYLNRFKVDVLKIDRSFVTGLEHDSRKGELVKAFIAVAKALDMEVVAEGVELPAQVDFLCANACSIGQGYLYGRPMPVAEFEALIGGP